MKVLVGWYNTNTGQLVDIPNFDYVENPRDPAWIPAYVDPYAEPWENPS
jgi:hypothetical protein